MNKILTILLMVLLVSVNSVLAVGDLDVTNVVNPTPGNPGTSVAGSFKVNNIGANTVSGIVFVKNDLVSAADPTQKILSSQISFNPASIASLAAGQDITVTSSAAILQGTKPGSYTGAVDVRDGSNPPAHSDTFQLTVVVNSLAQVSVDTFTDTTALEIKEEQGETATGTFVIRNTGNVDLSNLGLSHNITLTDNDNDAITLTFTGLPAVLAAGSSATITANANIDENVDFATYSGIVTVKDLVQNVQKTFKLDITVEPRICEEGVRSDGNSGGDNLRVEIREPGTSDRFSPGEKINVEVRVRNNDNEDQDVVVEAFLYDLDDNDILVEIDPTDSIEINKGNTEDFEFTLEVPFDVDIDHEIVLFVKAYVDDEEDENCGEIRKDLSLRRERHSVVVQKVTLTPSSLACGETFDATVEIQNIGTSDEDDVTVRLFDDELNIDQVSNPVDLDKFDNSGDESTIRFRDIRIPTNAERKQYQVEAILTFGSDTRSEFGTLTVNRCEEDTQANGETGQATLQTLVSSFSLNKGEAFTVPVTVTNANKGQVQFTLEVQNIEDFAQLTTPKILTLSSGQSETVFFNLRTKQDLIEGKYTGIVVLKSGTTIVDTKSFTVDAQSTSFLDRLGLGTDGLSGTKLFWIIADVILVIIAIFFLKLIFGSKKKKVE